MASVNLTSASDGSIRFSSNNDNCPIFIVIGDSFSQGALQNQRGADENLDPNYTYKCKNFQRSFSNTDATARPISDSSKALGTFKLWDQACYLMNAPTWANSTAYAVGDRRRHGGTTEDDQYVCIKAHTSNTSNDQPGSGTNWTEYWVQGAGWGYTGTGTTGRTPYGGNFTTGSVVPRAAKTSPANEDHWSAAAWSDSITWHGGSRTAAAPPATNGFTDAEFDGTTAGLFLADNTILWSFSRYFALNQVFKDADGGVAYPRYIHLGVNGSACQKALDALATLSWSPDYDAPVNGAGDKVSIYQWFNDCYLKPALEAVITGESLNAWIAGVIYIGGNTDCQVKYNLPYNCGGIWPSGINAQNSPAMNLGTNVAALADALETACSVSDIPFITMNPIEIPLGQTAGSPELGLSDINTGSVGEHATQYFQVGANALQTDYVSDYRKTFTVRPKRVDDRMVGSDNIHLTATGACALGYELADEWYTNFVDKGLQMHTATAPAAICP